MKNIQHPIIIFTRIQHSQQH